MAVSELVKRLEAWRRAIDFGHNAFAQDVLGVDKTTWSQVRRGQAPANAKFVGRIILRYPWLATFIEREGVQPPDMP